MAAYKADNILLDEITDYYFDGIYSFHHYCIWGRGDDRFKCKIDRLGKIFECQRGFGERDHLVMCFKT